MGVRIDDNYGSPHDGQEWPWDAQEGTQELYEFTPGGSFILDGSGQPTALWGDGDDVLWAEGEALLLASLQGLGKSTLGQQLALGRAGFAEYNTLLGYPIRPGDGRVLYLAMDRPRQIARSFRRMVGEFDRDRLDQQIPVWEGPPPHDMARFPELLLRMCQRAGASTVVVDSLKDAAVGLNDDEVGASWNRARQKALREGIEVLELHHLRKRTNGSVEAHVTIDDVYGSTWLTSGTGSVVMLTGEPGDPLVGLHHVKQPMNQVGPLKVSHDYETGRSTVWDAVDLVALARRPGGLSAKDAAAALYDLSDPKMNDVQKARRKLDKLTRDGRLKVVQQGDRTANRPTLWGVA